MNSEKQQLQFPVEWHYKIICKKDDKNALDKIIKVLREHNFSETPEKGNESSSGKYLTYKVSLTFNDITTMRNLSDALSTLPCVKYLI